MGADRMADRDHAPEAEVLAQRGRVVAVPVGFGPRHRRTAEAARVVGDDAMAVRERVDLPAPHAAIEREPVEKRSAGPSPRAS